MAHRGRLYPVAFRRDFNYNSDISNVSTLAREYLITLKSGVIPPYVVDGATFHLTPLPQPDAATLAWGQTDVDIGDFLWSIRLRVDFPELPDSWLRATWFLFKFEFLVSSWRGVPKSRDNPLDAGNLLTQAVLFTDFATFPLGANFNFSLATPAGY